MEDQKLKEILIDKNNEFKKLFLKHQEFEEKLQSFQQKKTKNEADIVEEQNLKKRKLQLKDAMQKMIIEFKKKLNQG
jgi:uncharacterized protein YdcH (DUF465 family)